jgi:ACR3 family arsenite efflux pump ArsB
MKERGLIMVLHSAVIGLILYIVMVFLFKQRPAIAENRSILIAAVVLIYMILFGHGMPNKLNGNL